MPTVTLVSIGIAPTLRRTWCGTRIRGVDIMPSHWQMTGRSTLTRVRTGRLRYVGLCLVLTVATGIVVAQAASGNDSASGMTAFARSTAEMVADKHVTVDEQHQSVVNTIACLKAGGVDVEGPLTVANSERWVYSHSAGTSADEQAEEEAVARACYDREFKAVDSYFMPADQPSETEMQGRARAFIGCLVSAGLVAQGAAEVRKDLAFEDVTTLADEARANGGESAQHTLDCLLSSRLATAVTYGR